VALAGVDLPDVGGPAGYRGGVAIVALDDRPLGRLAVSDRIGRCVRRLDPVVAAGVTTWTWDGRDEQGVPVLSGSWLVRLETSSGPRTATLGQSPITRGRVTLRIFATAGR
jgi:flagellar hook assembly protein FlgD